MLDVICSLGLIKHAQVIIHLLQCCCRLLDVAGGVAAGAVGERIWDKHEERKEEKEWERAEKVRHQGGCALHLIAGFWSSSCGEAL
jgi:hypothetical protein